MTETENGNSFVSQGSVATQDSDEDQRSQSSRGPGRSTVKVVRGPPALAGTLSLRNRFGAYQKWWVVLVDGQVAWWANEKSYFRGVKPRSEVAPPMVAWDVHPDPANTTTFTVVRVHDKQVLAVFDAEGSTHTRDVWIEAMQILRKRTSVQTMKDFIGESVKASRASTRKSVRNALERQAAVEAQKEGISVYDAAGLKVVEQRQRESTVHNGGPLPASLDAIYERGWCAIYVGDLISRNSEACLKENGIARIVDVLEPTAFPNEKRLKFDDIEYLEFPIALWDEVKDIRKDEVLAKVMAPLFAFVEQALQDGESVLIHCYAGAHRSGTAGVASMMYLEDLSATTALQRAQEKRPIIDAFASMDRLLRRLDRLLPQETMTKAIAACADDPSAALQEVFKDAIDEVAAQRTNVKSPRASKWEGSSRHTVKES